jgi:adenylate kinase family enzyme
MKIAIDGVSSTGKSTLARLVAENTGLPLISEDTLVQKAFSYGRAEGYAFTTEYMPDFTAEDVTIFELNFLKARYEIEESALSYVIDQSALGNMVYLLTFCSRNLSEEVLNEHVRRLERITQTYKSIWYLPFGVIPIEDDKRRTINPHFLFQMDCTLRGLMQFYESSLPLHKLFEADIAKRLAEVLATVPVPEKGLPLLGV